MLEFCSEVFLHIEAHFDSNTYIIPVCLLGEKKRANTSEFWASLCIYYLIVVGFKQVSWT